MRWPPCRTFEYKDRLYEIEKAGTVRPAVQGVADVLDPFRNELARRLYGQTPAEAQAKGECISCGLIVEGGGELDIAEYELTAMCPDCFARITGDTEFPFRSAAEWDNHPRFT